MSQRLSFLDHEAHLGTKSSDFFVELLRERFFVSVFYIDPAGHLDGSSLQEACLADVVVIWQMDYLAPLFLARGIPTVVVPMFDGSANMPDEHWRISSRASFVSFSWNMHDRLRVLGINTILTKFFKEPVPEDLLPKFDEFNIFLWQRRPEEGINGDAVTKLFGSQVDSMHIHDCPDTPDVVGKNFYKSLSSTRILTVSNWFDSVDDYVRCMSNCNVFVSPRRSEGIGMAHLEAMARGMFVLANDQPTHTEYITNWVNGVLFNADDIGFTVFPREQVSAMARMGWLTAQEGFTRWLDQRNDLLDFVQKTRTSEKLDNATIELLSTEIPRAYASGLENYSEYLNRNQEVVDVLSSADFKGVRRKRAWSIDSEQEEESVFPLYNDEINFSLGQARPYLRQGWAQDEHGWVWVQGQSASLVFEWPRLGVRLTRIKVDCRSLEEFAARTTVMVVFNGVLFAVFKAGGFWEEHDLVAESAFTQRVNRLSFFMDQSMQPDNDQRKLSIALRLVSIEAENLT